jgi:hypothetical protein
VIHLLELGAQFRGMRVISCAYKLRATDESARSIAAIETNKGAATMGGPGVADGIRSYCGDAAETATINCVPESRCTLWFDAERVPAAAPVASPASITPGTPVG